VNLERLGGGHYRLSGKVGFDSALATRTLVEEMLDAEDEDVRVRLVLDGAEGNSVLVGLMMGWFRYAHRREKEIVFVDVPSLVDHMIEFSGLDDVLPVASSGDGA